tara:strand:- start:24 stop:4493 length:4470 start_codon:yes stop_codon:yes gene_type:complete
MATLPTLEDGIFNSQTLSDQLYALTEPKVFNPRSEVESITAQELSIATESDEGEVRVSRANGILDHTGVAQLNGEGFDYELSIDQAYADGLNPEAIADIIENRRLKGEDMTLPEYMLMQNLMLGDNDINPYAARTLTNMETWNRLLQEELENNDQSGMSKALTFLDVNVLREITIGAFENITFRSNREGVEIREAFTSLTPSDFQEWAKEYVEERKSEGAFSSDSIWNLYKAANDATYLGNDPLAGLNAVFGAFDIATIGTTSLIKSGVKGSITSAKAGTLAYDAGTTAGKILSLSRVRRPVDAVSVIDGEVAGAQVLAKSVDDMGIQVDEVAAGRNLPEELDPTAGPSARPSGVVLRQSGRKTTLMEKMEEMNRRGSFGEYISPATITRVADEIAVRVASRVNDVVLNTRRVIDEGSDDFKVIIRMGKDGTGSAFRLKRDAVAIAARDPSLKVVRREEGRGWFIEAEQRVNVLGLPEAAESFKKGGFITDAINKMFGAATIRLGDRIGAKFLQAEAGQALIGDLIKPYQKLINKLRGPEQTNLSDFMTQIRDGELSHLRTAPTRESFEALYQTMYGAKASKQLLDAYDALIDISDTAWQITSSKRLKRVVADGGVYADEIGEFGEIVYRVDGQKITIPDSEHILDLATGRSLLKSDLGADQIVFKVPSTHLDHLFVTNVKSTRALERVDVMPYNAGGPRTNAQFRWFVGSATSQSLASGNVISGGFKTLLGSFGKEQAETAVRQLNNITAKVKVLMGEQGVDDVSQLALSKNQYDELGEVIRQNNSWNKHVTDLEDLVKLSIKYGFKFREEFAAKARDQKISIVDEGEDISFSGVTYGEQVGSRLNMKRGDTPLFEYGGKEAVNASPVSAIADQFGSEAFGYTNRAASQNAVVGWVKLAESNEGIVTFPKGVPTNDFLNRFLGAEVSKSGKFNDLAAQLREQQDVIKRRLNQNTWASDKWDVFTSSATEAIFEKSGFKVDLTKTDPSSQLLKVGFYSKFGFFNPDQFMLQALHGLTIAAVSPLQGMKALGLAAPMLIVTSLPQGATRNLAIKRLAKSGLIAEDELTDLIRYIDESGRNIVDTQILELQAPQKFGVRSTMLGKAAAGAETFLDKSTMFFKEGERATRMSALTTAFLEHRVKRPQVDPFSAEGRTWITNREQDLSFRMTTASRSFVQSGPMRVPTQWLTFSLRALENIVVGRNFTVGERARMFAVQGPLYGMTGLGVGQLTGYVTEKLGYKANDPETVETFNRIKYGMVDALMSNLLGTETAYATRVAPVDQLQDTWKKLFDKEFMTVIAGPSGEIARDMYQVGMSALSAMFSGQGTMAREDLTQLLRNLSTVDKAVKIKELIETGNYRSRTKKLAIGNLDKMSAAAVLFGATPAPVQNYYDYSEMVFKEGESSRKLERELRAKSDTAIRLLTSGNESDMLYGEKLFYEVNDRLWSSNLTNELKLGIQKRLARGEVFRDVMKNASRLGLAYDATLLSQQQ